jgi:hypothetical protein
MQGARVSRSVAWDALKRAGGRAATALRDELMRVRLDGEVLGRLAEEYAAYRWGGWVGWRLWLVALWGKGEEGMCVFVVTDDDRALIRGLKLPTMFCAARGLRYRDRGEEGEDDEAAVEEERVMEVDGESAAAAAAAPREGRRAHSAAAGGPPSSSAPAAPGGGGQAAAAAVRAGAQWARCDSRSPPYKVPRWKAQQSATGFSPEEGAAGPLAAAAAANAGSPAVAADAAAGDEPAPPTAAAVAAAAADKRARAAAAAMRERHAPLRQLQALTRAGEWEGAQALIEAAAPGLLTDKHPELLFDVQRARFARLAATGDVAAALEFARRDMTPLADKHPSLVPALKAAMAALLPGSGRASGSSSGGAPDESSLAAALLEALAKALSLQGPQLMVLLRALLGVHRAWFRMQRCADPFASALGLDELRGDGERAAAGAAATARPGGVDNGGGTGAAAAAAAGGSGAGAAAAGGGGDDSDDSDGGGEEVDEGSIIRLMEILEIPRGLAIELLVQHHGNVEDAVMQVVAG